MRLFEEFSEKEEEMSLAGSLLIAHPSQTQGYFKRTVVLLIVHSTEDGSLGLILNRPLEKKLGDYNSGLLGSELESVPLFDGGPVNGDQLILVAWKQTDRNTLKFYFGIDEAKACELIASDPEFEVRGFFGYAGWSEHQLEGELQMDAWVLTELSAKLSKLDSPDTWRKLLAAKGPKMQLLSGEPQDPSLN